MCYTDEKGGFYDSNLSIKRWSGPSVSNLSKNLAVLEAYPIVRKTGNRVTKEMQARGYKIIRLTQLQVVRFWGEKETVWLKFLSL